MKLLKYCGLFSCMALLAAGGLAETALASDIAPARPWSFPGQDYSLREVMIPMRDGVRLHTVILVPNSPRRAPILLTRTPFDASGRLINPGALKLSELLPPSEQPFVQAGYIRVFQDVRGKFASEGEYEVTRPVRGPLNRSTTDHATDAYDTIDWLVRNVPEANGRVGVIGSSYEGFTTAMALLAPHPALKAAVPISPMVDGWRGDDWFHNGAFRQTTFDFMAVQLLRKGFGVSLPRADGDDYQGFLKLGSAKAVAEATGFDENPFWRKLVAHPAYDDFWRGQALDTLLSGQASGVPTLWVGALWDQEDSWGAIHGYEAQERFDARNDQNYLVMGPWRHGGMFADGSTLGALSFGSDTAASFRDKLLIPFLDAHLKDQAPGVDIPPVSAFETGSNTWRSLPAWSACQTRCAAAPRPLYLADDHKLSWDRARLGKAGQDTFVSDPARPVPMAKTPIALPDPDQWRTWMAADQSFLSDRKDVLTYMTPVLKEAVTVRGQPIAELFAATTGADADWVVKLIDVYPQDGTAMAGQQIMISSEIFRGRYRQGLDAPKALQAGKVEHYSFSLPPVSHQFKPGHRLMVQIQSSWFPLYDRNPQTFVSNIFEADPEAYKAQTHTITRSRRYPSAVLLPVVSSTP